MGKMNTRADLLLDNTTVERQDFDCTRGERFITHFESAIEPGVIFSPDRIQTMHAGRPLLSRYDLPAVAERMTKSVLANRPRDMWRYRELLPVGNRIKPVSLGESMSPLIPCSRLAEEYGLQHVWIKDESRLPTGSFKSRGLSLAVTMAKHLGIQRIAMSSNGNAGGAMALYAARAGLESVVFMPEDTMRVHLSECLESNAHLFVTNGLIDENGAAIRQGHDRGLWFDISTMKEPYRLEGKKTMGLELAEQFRWQLPDVILYPTGGGTALIAMWKAFCELREMGFLDSETMPRMIACQTTGCMPVYTAFQNGRRFATRHENAATMATGLRVPSALGDFMILDALSESGGQALAGCESDIRLYQKKVAALEGLMICPESATCIDALEQLIDAKLIARDDRIVIFNTAAGQKYIDPFEINPDRLDVKQPIDWTAFQHRLDADRRRADPSPETG
jgi:threonine synthase